MMQPKNMQSSIASRMLLVQRSSSTRPGSWATQSDTSQMLVAHPLDEKSEQGASELDKVRRNFRMLHTSIRHQVDSPNVFTRSYTTLGPGSRECLPMEWLPSRRCTMVWAGLLIFGHVKTVIAVHWHVVVNLRWLMPELTNI